MFRISDNVSPDEWRRGSACGVSAHENRGWWTWATALRQGRSGSHAELEDVTSIPFQALLRGMKHEQVNWSREWGSAGAGLLPSLAQTAIRGSHDRRSHGRSQLRGHWRAHYLNFNSRLGFSPLPTIDTLLRAPKVNDNYITFLLQGRGAPTSGAGRGGRLMMRKS